MFEVIRPAPGVIPTKPGIYKVPVDVYREIDAINFSSLKYVGESLMSYDWHKKQPNKETDAMAFGTAFHALVLEPDAFDAEYVVLPENPYDGRTAEGKEFKKNHITPLLERIAAEGLISLDAATKAELDEMAANYCSHPEIAPFLEADGYAELTLVWNDAETGMLCKGRLDKLLADGQIFGVKTTSKFAARQFASHAWELGYHAQWAYYHDAAVTLGITVPRVAEGVICSNGPYDCALYNVDTDVLKRGRDAYRGWLRALKNRPPADRWQGQYPEAIEFRAPAWAGNGEYELEHSIGAFVDALKQEVQE